MARTAATRKTNALGRSTLLAAIASSAMLAPSRIHIKELDADVFVRRLTLGERDQYFEDMKEVDGNGNREAFIYAMAEEDGSPMFTLDDIQIVKDLPPSLILDVLNEFNLVNRFIVKLPERKKDGTEPEDDDLKNS